MRKKTVDYIVDNIFWLILSFFPIIAYLFYIFAFGQNPNMAFPESGSSTFLGFYQFISRIGLEMSTRNPIYLAIFSIFGGNGVVPLFAQNGMLVFFSYFCTVQIVHLIIDILLFIVRLAHKWMNKAIQGD